MIQKVFRMLAIFFTFALLLSPVYFKNIRHYLTSVKIISGEFENITASSSGYRCLNSGKIALPNDDSIQILHITSPNCKACLEDIEIWNNLQLELEKIVKRKKDKIEIINVLKNVQLDKSKEFLEELVKAPSEESIQSFAENNISVCTIALSETQFNSMNIDSLPSVFIVNRGEVIYSIIGKLAEGDIEKILAVIQKMIK